MSYFNQIAEMLGVEIEERFFVQGPTGRLRKEYFFKEDGLCTDDGEAPTTLSAILRGGYTVIKKPWVPTPGSYYYFVHVQVTGFCIVLSACYSGTMSDLIHIRLGNCYETEEEAKVNFDKWKNFCSSEERIDWE